MPRLLLGAIHEREGADEMLGEAAEPRAVCLPRWRLELPGDSLAGTFPPAVRRVRGVRASFGDFFVGPSEKGMGSASSTQTVLMAPPGRSLPPPAAPSREGSLFGGPLLEIEPLQPEGPPDSELSASPAGELFTGPPEMGGDDMDAMGPAQMGMPDLQLESASEPKDIDGPKDEVIEYWAVAEPGENGQTIVHQGHAVHHIRHGKDFVEHHQALRHHNHRHYVRHVGHGSGHRRHHHEHREAKPATAHEKPDRSQSEPLLVAPPQPLPTAATAAATAAKAASVATTADCGGDEGTAFACKRGVGGMLAIFAQAYLWGHVFVTLFKPHRQARPAQQPGASDAGQAGAAAAPAGRPAHEEPPT
eukprot:CAMPEP_0175372870 /NCGR_PEP_ID=MMETSP0095-20121207/22447_1 /TAXON_ID=311494 /ORGANISM="Alexandrium monilatum, Strain CCMP3105" /LENGTH=360 /DNA_ID=CAMNT_0016671065 /DNA_START=14 /DNA_END=1093 /DNA_ORIENTATION=+